MLCAINDVCNQIYLVTSDMAVGSCIVSPDHSMTCRPRLAGYPRTALTSATAQPNFHFAMLTIYPITPQTHAEDRPVIS